MSLSWLHHFTVSYTTQKSTAIKNKDAHLQRHNNFLSGMPDSDNTNQELFTRFSH